MSKVVTLKNFKINEFKQVLGRTERLANWINLVLTPSTIESYVSAKGDSLIKNIKINASNIYQFDSVDGIDLIKLSIADGNFFKKTVLGAMKEFDVCDIVMNINENDSSVLDLQLSNPLVNIKIRTSPLTMYWEYVTNEVKKELFDYSNHTATFNLEPLQIKRILELSAINKSSDKPVNYFELHGKDGKIIAFDPSWDLNLMNYDGKDFAIKISKENVSTLDNETVKVFVCPDTEKGGKALFIFKTENVESCTIISLMQDFAEFAGIQNKEEDNFYNQTEAFAQFDPATFFTGNNSFE